MSEDRDLDHLIVAYLGDDLDAAGMAELEQRLASDPASSARMAWWCRQDLSLRGLAPVRSATRSSRGRRPPATVLPWGIAAAAVLALAVTWWQASARSATPPPSPVAAIPALAMVQTCTGTAWAQRGDRRLPLAAGEALAAGDALTCSGGLLTLGYPDGTTVTLSDDSVAVLGDSDAGKRLRLDRGQLQAVVAHQPLERPLRFLTAQAEAIVLGTRLKLASWDDSTRLDVTEGSVALQRGRDQRVTVDAGHYGMAKAGADLVVRPIPPMPPPPRVTLTSPADGTTFTAPADITITADVASDAGPIAKVDLYAGEQRLATIAAKPYAFAWRNAPPGTHALTAQVFDATGASARSAAVTIAINAPPVSDAATGDTVMGYDFEDGIRPADLQDGDIVTGPPRPGNRFCLAGIQKQQGDAFKKEIWIGRTGTGLFHYAAGMQVSFDCWFTSGTGRFSLGVWDSTQEKSMWVETAPPQGQWTRVSLRLDDVRDGSDDSVRLAPNDLILNVIIGAFGSPDDSLYIDNIEITRPK